MLERICNALKSRVARPKAAPRPRLSFRPALERLETRALMSANVLQTNLVSDLPGVAAVQDPNLVNPWGISESAGSPFWISDNNAGVSTLYNVPGANNTPVSINGLVVSIPTPGDPTRIERRPHRDRVQHRRRQERRVPGQRRGQERKPDHRLGDLPVRHRGRHHRRLEPRRQPHGLRPGQGRNLRHHRRGQLRQQLHDPTPTANGAVYKGLTIATSATPIFARPQHACSTPPTSAPARSTSTTRTSSP